MNAVLCITIVNWWNVKLVDVDVEWCTVALKGYLIFSPAKCPAQHSALQWGTITVDALLNLMVLWWSSTRHRGEPFLISRQETPQRHAVKNNRGTFSHCNPVFPGKDLWEGDRFLNNCTTLLCRSQGRRIPAAPAEQSPLSISLLQRGPVQAAGETSRAAQWSHSCINYQKYQTTHKSAVYLFIWLWWSDFWQNSEMCEEWEKS